jgi:hypothetical protein
MILRYKEEWTTAQFRNFLTMYIWQITLVIFNSAWPSGIKCVRLHTGVNKAANKWTIPTIHCQKQVWKRTFFTIFISRLLTSKMSLFRRYYKQLMSKKIFYNKGRKRYLYLCLYIIYDVWTVMYSDIVCSVFILKISKIYSIVQFLPVFGNEICLGQKMGPKNWTLLGQVLWGEGGGGWPRV